MRPALGLSCSSLVAAFLLSCGGVQDNGGAAGTGGAGAADRGGQSPETGGVAGGLFGLGGTSESGGRGAGFGLGPPMCNPTEPGMPGFESCGGGTFHRFAQLDCAPAVSVEPCDNNISYDSDAGLPTGQCLGADYCTAASNGYCNVDPSPNSAVGCACAYGCIRDADCGTGQICRCGTPAGQCVTATCVTDSDCGAGLLCLSYANPCDGGSGFACQTPLDQCATDADCASCCESSKCTLSGDGRRTCRYLDCGLL